VLNNWQACALCDRGWDEHGIGDRDRGTQESTEAGSHELSLAKVRRGAAADELGVVVMLVIAGKDPGRTLGTASESTPVSIAVTIAPKRTRRPGRKAAGSHVDAHLKSALAR
jgi:hypothetical protein